MAKSKLKVVLDSNILISALIFGGKPSEVLTAGFGDRYYLVTSSFISEEVVRGLVKLGHTLIEAETLVEAYESAAKLATIKNITPLSRDPKDDPILATAQHGSADYIVTGDKDLLVLEHYGKCKILKPADFLMLLGQALQSKVKH